MTDLSYFVLPDDGMTPVLDLINQTQRTLDVYIFKMENDEIEQALDEAVKRGVVVRVILDKTSDTSAAAYQRLTQAGLAVKWGPPYFPRSHAKCFVIDNALAAITTINFVADWNVTRDYGMTTHDEAVIAALNATFTADWQQQQGQPSADQCEPLIITPGDSRAAILDFIHAAKSSLLIEHEQFSDPQVIDALASRANAGVTVRMVLSAAKSTDGATQLCRLAPSVQAVFPTALKIHAKMMVRDDDTMLLGSTNLIAESLDRRREVSVLVTDPAAVNRTTTTFNQDFATGSRGQ